MEPRDQHAVVERPHLARVEALAEGVGGDVVLVLAVLAVEQLRRHDDRRRSVEQRDLEREHRQVAVGEADEALRPHAHPLAGGRAPDEVAREDAVAEVEHPLVRLEVGVAQQQRLVVDVQLHQLGVGDVDDRLTRLGEAERLLGVADVPRLVEAVDERAVAVRVAALLGVGAHPDVAVGDGEQRLGQPEVVDVVLALDEPPRVGREPVQVEVVGRVAPHAGSSRRRAARRDRRRRRRRRWRGGRRGRRRDRRRRRGRRRPPGRRRRRTGRPRRRPTSPAATPRRSAAARNRSGAGLPAMCSVAASDAVGDDVEARRQPGRLEHLAGVARRRARRRPWCRASPGGRGSAPSRDTARSPRRATSLWNTSFLRLPSALTEPSPGGSVGSPSGRVSPREASIERTPSKRGLPST